jgi:hypothetical protein
MVQLGIKYEIGGDSMRESKIEEKLQASTTKTGREYGAKFQYGEFVVTGDASIPILAYEVWNEQKKLYPPEVKLDRKKARVAIAGIPCEVWYMVPNAVYGHMTHKGRRTGQVLKVSVDGNLIKEVRMM